MTVEAQGYAISESVLTEAEHRAVSDWVESNAWRFGLEGWTINVHYDLLEPESDDLCRVNPIENTPYCHLWVSAAFRHLSPSAKRQALVHEMLHPRFVPAFDQVRLDIRGLLSHPVHDVLWLTFKRNVEYAVDHIARGLAGLFPLLEWPDEEVEVGVQVATENTEVVAGPPGQRPGVDYCS